MTAVQKKWGEPDETMAFQDYRAKGGFFVANSRFAYGETSTPTTLVWTYKDKGKALFFEKRGLFFDERHTLIMVWTLVGWEKLQTKTDELPTK